MYGHVFAQVLYSHGCRYSLKILCKCEYCTLSGSCLGMLYMFRMASKSKYVGITQVLNILLDFIKDFLCRKCNIISFTYLYSSSTAQHGNCLHVLGGNMQCYVGLYLQFFTINNKYFS